MFSFKRKYVSNLERSKEKISHDAHLSSLMDFSKQIRNRIIFFVLFNVYAFLNVLATTDKDIFLLNPVKMPLLNIELPLLAFYIVVPFMLVSLHFNLMYRLLSYRAFLKRSLENHRRTIDSLPFGIYEEILLGRELLLKDILKVFFFFITYLMPVIVLLSFWYRFADYHSFTISSYHLILASISFVVAFYFVSIKKILKPLTEADVYLKEFIKSVTNKEYFQILSKLLNWIVYYFIPLTFVSLFAWAFIYPYHLIIKEVSKSAEEAINEEFIKEKENLIEDKLGFLVSRFRGLEDYLKRPTLNVSGEILVKGVDKETLEILREFKNGNKPLLHYVLRTNYSRRNFSFADLSESILVNSNLREVNFSGAILWKANLSSVILVEANLSGAFLWGANLSGAYLGRAILFNAILEKANFSDVNLIKANLSSADLKEVNLSDADLRMVNLSGADLWGANFSGADLWGANLSGAYLGRAILVNAILEEASLSGANLTEANLSGAFLGGANLSGAFLGGANLSDAYLLGANLSGAYLWGANLSSADLRKANFSGSFMREVDFSGAILMHAKLKGVCGNKICNKPAVKRLGKKADLSKIRNEVLTKQKIMMIIKSWEKLTKDFSESEKRKFLKKWEKLLYQYEGKTTLDWIRAQDVDLGKFTEQDLREFLRALILGLNKDDFTYEFMLYIKYLITSNKLSEDNIIDFIRNYLKKEKEIVNHIDYLQFGYPFKEQALQLLDETEKELIKQYSPIK